MCGGNTEKVRQPAYYSPVDGRRHSWKRISHINGKKLISNVPGKVSTNPQRV